MFFAVSKSAVTKANFPSGGCCRLHKYSVVLPFLAHPFHLCGGPLLDCVQDPNVVLKGRPERSEALQEDNTRLAMS